MNDTRDIEELPKSLSDFENKDHGQVGCQQMRHSNSYNYARNFHENHEAVKHRFPVPTICTKCQAKLFKSEIRGLCCRNGAIVLPKISSAERCQYSLPTTSQVAGILIETGRLRWISTHQKDIRCDLYQGLQDCLIPGENNTGIVSEEPTVLPSSFTGGRRDMFLLDNQLPFCGKIMVLGGDVRQVLPVVLRGIREQIVMASIVQSSLWKNVTILSFA
ncbi:hypothetical protein Leryth_019641 [Lithospermum erythrorhizon]|nr:hypothetical protein Leryth_019641 [Lithospermum erythrorhizon]